MKLLPYALCERGFKTVSALLVELAKLSQVDDLSIQHGFLKT